MGKWGFSSGRERHDGALSSVGEIPENSGWNLSMKPCCSGAQSSSSVHPSDLDKGAPVRKMTLPPASSITDSREYLGDKRRYALQALERSRSRLLFQKESIRRVEQGIN